MTHQALRKLAEHLHAAACEAEAAASDALKAQLPGMAWSAWLETPEEIANALDLAAETGVAVEVSLERLPDSPFAVPSPVRGVVRSAEPGSWWVSVGSIGRRVQVSREPLDGHLVPTAVRCRVETTTTALESAP